MSAVWRTARALRTLSSTRTRAQISSIRSSIRRATGSSHIVAQYRQPPQLTKHQKFRSELLSGFMWFWILWHCWHDPDAVLGHFPWPDTNAWTDEELGIPPDGE